MLIYVFCLHFYQEWEELVKKQPDGTVKKIRRRIVVVKYVKGKPDADDGTKSDGAVEPEKGGDKTPEKGEIVEEPELEEEEIKMDEKSLDFNKLFDDPVCISFSNVKFSDTIVFILSSHYLR
jgi:hypothetical protein